MALATRCMMCFIALQLRSADMTGCSDCCTPGGSCESAFRGRPGVCCASNQCCPVGDYCMRCASGFQCAHYPYGRCEEDVSEPVSVFQIASFLIGGMLLFLVLQGVCRYLCDRMPWQTQPTIVSSAGQVVACPEYQDSDAPQNDGVMSGLVAGMVMDTVISEIDEPPTYREATEAGYEPDRV